MFLTNSCTPGVTVSTLPHYGLGILRQEQIGVIAADLLKLSHKLFVAFEFGESVAQLLY